MSLTRWIAWTISFIVAPAWFTRALPPSTTQAPINI